MIERRPLFESQPKLNRLVSKVEDQIKDFESRLSDLETDLAKTSDEGDRKLMQDEIDHLKRRVAEYRENMKHKLAH